MMHNLFGEGRFSHNKSVHQDKKQIVKTHIEYMS